MARVMISYRNIESQRDFASSLEKVLANVGIQTWIDFKNIPRLSRWEDEIFKGIINSDYVVLCLSPEYFESETCLFECYIARGYGKTLLPLILPCDEEKPLESQESVYRLIPQFEETRGIELLNFLNFHSQRIVGLEQDHTQLIERLINAITNPIPSNIDYDVFCSFKSSQAKFATQVADDLNKSGIKTFIHTRAIDAGVDWRHFSWNAMLRAKIHIVFLSPDVAQSEFISNEALVTRTRQDAVFIPIVVAAFADDAVAKSTIRDTFASSKNLSVLNEIQWLIPDNDYVVFVDGLISDIRALLSQQDG